MVARNDIVSAALLAIRKEYGVEVKSWDQDDWYGELESVIDGLLYEEEYAKYGYLDADGRPSEDAEAILERLVFAGVRKALGRRHTCDPYYDPAFRGKDGF